MNDFIKEITLVSALAGFIFISTRNANREHFEIPDGYDCIKCEKMEQRGDTIIVKYYFCIEHNE